MALCGHFLKMYSTPHSSVTIVRIDIDNSFSGCCEVSKFVEEMGKRNGNRPFKRLSSNSPQRVLCTSLPCLLRCKKLGKRHLRLLMQRLEVKMWTNSNRRPFLRSKRHKEQILFGCGVFDAKQPCCVIFVSNIFNLINTHTQSSSLTVRRAFGTSFASSIVSYKLS